MHAVGGVLQRGGNPATPAHPRPGGERLAEQFGRGQPAADGGRDPPVGVVEGPRGGDQVEHGVLHRGPRQMPRRLPFRNQPPRSVDNHAAHLLVLPRTTPGRDAHVNPCTLLVNQAMDLGCGLVAEHSARPHVQYSRPQPPLPRGFSGERRIHPGVQALPRSSAEPPLDRLVGETRVERLLPGNDTCLELKLAKPSKALLIFHAPTLNRPPGPRHHARRPVDNRIVDRYGPYEGHNDPR